MWLNDISEPLQSGSTPFPLSPIKSHNISCFNQISKLCELTCRVSNPYSERFSASLLEEIVQTIYAVNPSQSLSGSQPTKRSAYVLLEERLDKFYLEIPSHLQIRKPSSSDNPDSSNYSPPHVYTLHLLFWCTAILLHRPL